MKKIVLLLMTALLFSCGNVNHDKKTRRTTIKPATKTQFDLGVKIAKGVTNENYLQFFNQNKSWFEQGKFVEDKFFVSPELSISGKPYTGQFAFYGINGKKSDFIYGVSFYGKPLEKLWTVHYFHSTTESIIGALERDYKRHYNDKEGIIPNEIIPFKY